MEIHNKIASLIIKFRKGALNEHEKRELDEWIGLSQENKRLFESLTDEFYLKKLFEINVKEERKDIIQLYEQETGKSISMESKRPYYLVIGILLIAGIISYKYLSFDRSTTALTNQTDIVPATTTRELGFAKIGDKATLALSNGLTIFLDSLEKGDSILCGRNYVKRIEEDKLKIMPAIEMHPERNFDQPKEILYASLNVPRGKQYQVLLADGSAACLNEFTSFRFPMTFNSNKRDVTLVGEGYFDVRPLIILEDKVPFVVNIKNMMVNVVGTRFNVNAYDDGRDVKTTLIEGEIEIVLGNSIKKMIPGQQARLSQDGSLTIEYKNNVQEDIAWINNTLIFQDKPLKLILQQLSQLYNMQFFFECCEDNLYTITLYRDMSLADALKRIEGLDEFYFVSEGKKIIVKKGSLKR